MEDVTVLRMHSERAGTVGLVRLLPSFGITNLRTQIVFSEGENGNDEGPSRPRPDTPEFGQAKPSIPFIGSMALYIRTTRALACG